MTLLEYFVWIISILWIYILWTRRRFYALLLKVPGPAGYPLIGMAHKFRNREDILQVFSQEEEKFGTFVLSWLGPAPFLILSDPQLIQDILTSPHCVSKGFIYDVIDDGIGRGLFSMKDPEWSAHRKMLNPTFGHRVLMSFIEIFNSETDKLLISLNKFIGKGEIDLMETFQKFTLDIATMTTMGRSASTQRASHNESLLECYQCVLENMTEMATSPWLRYRAIQWFFGKYAKYSNAKKQIRNFIQNLINEKLQNSHESLSADDEGYSSKNKNIFINVAIDLLNKGDFTMENVEDESNVLVFGAFETTSNTIAYTLMMLAMFPTCQEKAFEEIVAVCGDRDRHSFYVSHGDIQEMDYLDMIIKETMRLMAPVPLVARQTSQDVKLSNGITLPKGIQVAIDIFHMHRSKEIWGPDAHIFNPENFLPSNIENKHSYAFIPFTKGIRTCIGSKYAMLSTKIALVKLIRNYRFSTTFNFQDLIFVEDISIKLKKIPLLELHERD